MRGVLSTRRWHWWVGQSGKRYLFEVLLPSDIGEADGAGIVYIPARERPDGFFDPLYIGQTRDGYDRISGHEKLAAARRLGMTHFHICWISNRAERFDVETDLRRNIWTPLNDQPTPARPVPLPDIGALGSLGPWPPLPSAGPLSGVAELLSPLSNIDSVFGLAAALAPPPGGLLTAERPAGLLALAAGSGLAPLPASTGPGHGLGAPPEPWSALDVCDTLGLLARRR